jgi:hypothetical protein
VRRHRLHLCQVLALALALAFSSASGGYTKPGEARRYVIICDFLLWFKSADGLLMSGINLQCALPV